MKKSFVIIGGGATCAALLLNASEELKSKVEIIVIDPAASIGTGRAYETADEENLLNVAASNMGLLQSDPAHFQRWLTRKGHNEASFAHWPFVPRKLFGEYIRESLKTVSHRHVRSKAVDISPRSFGYTLVLENGQTVKADFLAIATGYAPDQNIFSQKTSGHLDRIIFPKDAETLSFDGKKEVLIIGTGLTAVDVWKRLRKNPEAHFTLLSRRGLIPLPHVPPKESKRFPILSGMTPQQVLDVARSLYSFQGIPWQKIADEIRLQSKAIWTCWSANEKKQFLRHMRPYWEIIRHRLPPSIHAELAQDLSSGKVKALPGRIRALRGNIDGVSVGIKSSGREEERSYDYVVLATGAVIDQGLFKTRHFPGIKFSTNNFGYINVSAPNIWFAGPSSKATYWEITAVPDIRVQAQEICQKILERVDSGKSLLQYRFQDHPHSTGESYFLHLKNSLGFGQHLGTKAIHSIVHALFPFYYTDNTSNDMRDFSIKLSKRRQKDKL